MPFGIHNPLPSTLRSECKKAGKILASFIDPRQSFGPDKVIPPEILRSAKGLAVITIFKAGFLGSARFGSGLVVARLSDGTWSAPSAIATGGAGFGGQIGFELTDFVFILNDAAAVRTFSQQGSLTLGGNISVAAGPIGRNAEAAGAASLKGVAGIFSYSKTKGLFAGVSVEGSVLIERKDANEKLYNSRISAKQLLEGAVRPPPEAEPLMRVLESRAFSGAGGSDSVYNDIPSYDDDGGPTSPTYGANRTRPESYGGGGPAYDDDVYNQRPSRSNTYHGGGYGDSKANPDETFDSIGAGSRRGTFGADGKPSRPTAPKPHFKPRASAGSVARDQAVALFTFDAAQAGDLGFKKGDVITVIKRTEKAEDWWTGRIGGREGIFPSNYVEPRT